jgi:hypothetical protein
MDLPPHIPKECKESSTFPTNKRVYYSIIKPSEAVLFQVAENPLVSFREGGNV